MALHSPHLPLRPNQIPSCPGLRPTPPAWPVPARAPVLQRGQLSAQRELPLHPRR